MVGDTGGLGDRFCKHFLAQGDEVRGLSRRTNILPNDFGENSHITALTRLIMLIWRISLKSYLLRVGAQKSFKLHRSC